MSLGGLAAATINLAGIRHGYYKDLARDNRISESPIPAARGQVLDRKGRVLAKSLYQYFKTEGDQKVLEEAGEFKGYRFEGKDLSFELERYYPYGEAMALVTGYVGKATEDDLTKKGCSGQGFGREEMMGKSGIEEVEDCRLRGETGRRLVETDARGRYIRELGREDPKTGGEVSLSLDAYWQEKIYKTAKSDGRKIAVIISEVKTGKILVMVSNPSFDPNVFSYIRDNQAIEGYLGDGKNLPMLNRVIAGKYHPGSVFKPVLAVGGLETGVIKRDDLIEDTGVIKVGEYSYSNWLWTKRGGTDGMVDMVKAIKRSNDIYFYRLGERMGVGRIKEWGDRFGYGKKTGVELIGEQEGIVPDEEWKIKAKGEKWYLGNTYHLSIGQGDVSVTPIQVNQMTNIVANDGVKCQMSILKDKKPVCLDLKINKENLATVKKGMMEACSTGGTAWPLFNFKTPLACKTGTAEVGDGTKDTQAWLTAFAPADDPQISITVLVERGGEGSDEAAPIVGDILKEWFNEPETVVPRYDKTIQNSKIKNQN